jgi:hypothetical protein
MSRGSLGASSPYLTNAERAIIGLAVELSCSISAEMERRIRRDERARVVDDLRRSGIFAISREPSRRRIASRCYPGADALEAEVRRDERLLMVRELRREARLSGAAGRDGDALELAAIRLETKTTLE